MQTNAKMRKAIVTISFCALIGSTFCCLIRLPRIQGSVRTSVEPPPRPAAPSISIYDAFRQSNLAMIEAEQAEQAQKQRNAHQHQEPSGAPWPTATVPTNR